VGDIQVIGVAPPRESNRVLAMPTGSRISFWINCRQIRAATHSITAPGRRSLSSNKRAFSALFCLLLLLERAMQVAVNGEECRAKISGVGRSEPTKNCTESQSQAAFVIIRVVKTIAFCLASLLGAGAGSLPAADVSTPPLTRSIVLRVRLDGVDVVFHEFAAATARAGLKCHPYSMVGYRENFCDVGTDVSILGLRALEPPGFETEALTLEVHALGHGSVRDRELTAIGDRVIDQIKASLKGNAIVDGMVECTETRECCALLSPYQGCKLPVSDVSNVNR
jgi:hypothetical protein